MTDATFAGTALSTAVPEALITKVTRTLLGSVRDTYVEVPGYDGSWVFPERPGDRRVVIALHLLGEASTYPIDQTGFEARRAAVRALANWVASSDTAALVIDDEDDRYWVAKLASAPDPDEWLHTATIELEFRVGPYALDNDPSTETWTATPDDPHAFTVPDDLDARPVIEVTPSGALSDGFTITVNGTPLVYGTAVGGSDTITLNSISYTVNTGANEDTDLVGYFDPDTLSMADLNGDFGVLTPGDNEVTIDGAADVAVTWRRRYR